jgi:Prokaryotic homologs of the JAB domain
MAIDPNLKPRISVLRPGGAISEVEVPNLDPATIHAEISEGHHFNPTDPVFQQLTRNAVQPTAAGALENTPDFQANAVRAWESAGGGTLPAEGGMMISRNGRSGVLPASTGYNERTMPDTASTFGTLHTHPNTRDPKPSGDDVADARKLGKPLYVLSRDALYMIRPSDGASIKVFDKANLPGQFAKQAKQSKQAKRPAPKQVR